MIKRIMIDLWIPMILGALAGFILLAILNHLFPEDPDEFPELIIEIVSNLSEVTTCSEVGLTLQSAKFDGKSITYICSQ